MLGENLDLSSDAPLAPSVPESPTGRPFVGIHFLCCDVYARLYKNREQTAYVGHCPKCGKPVQIRIGPGGTDARFFTAT